MSFLQDQTPADGRRVFRDGWFIAFLPFRDPNSWRCRFGQWECDVISAANRKWSRAFGTPRGFSEWESF